MIRIVTDSTANLSPEFVREHNVAVVPLKVQMGADTFREGVDLSLDTFFERLPHTTPLPTTSQPSPLEFEESYSEILATGDEIISLHISSDLSGTHNSARNAAMNAGEEKITVVDTRSISAGLGLFVLMAARLAKAGKSREEIAAAIEAKVGDMQLILTMDTLEYLKRGGRIGGAAAFVGGLLKVKPMILVKDGKLEAGERARSRRKALDLLVAKQVERFGDQPLWVGVAEAQADDVAELEQLVRNELNVQEMIRCQIGPVVATHTGPNTIGIAAMPAPTL